MIKKLALSLVVAAVAATASADTGIFANYVVLDLGSGSTFYDLGPQDTQLPNFSSLNGTVFGPGDSFRLTGGETNTFKNNNTSGNGFNDIGTPSFLYSVVPNGVSGSFPLAFDSQTTSPTGSIDQKWQTLGQNVNLLAGLAPGDYTVNFRVTAPTGNNGNFSGGNILDSGAFSASVTVVPEPSSLSLLAGPAILGAWFFVRRRRA